MGGRMSTVPQARLVRQVRAALERFGLTLAVAESCTGGLLSAALTQRAGASRSFVGGVVAYGDGVKASVLRVPRRVLARHGAVSRACALAMAQGARVALGAEVTVAVTGIAGPGGAVPGKPVGTVWVAVIGPGRRTTTKRHRFQGAREQVQRQAVRAALELLASHLS